VQAVRIDLSPPCSHVNGSATKTKGKQNEAKEIIKLLLKFGANPSLKNKNGKRPVDYVSDDAILRLLNAKRA
jgi:hypothetical protein